VVRHAPHRETPLAPDSFPVDRLWWLEGQASAPVAPGRLTIGCHRIGGLRVICQEADDHAFVHTSHYDFSERLAGT
jgi:hypothetical protein